MKLRTMLTLLTVVCLLPVSLALAQQGDTQEEQIKAYIEMMRKNLRTERNTIVDQAMELEPAGKAKFWAVYDQYSKEVQALWDQRLENIKKYSEHFEQMTDDVADELAVKAIDIHAQRVQILKKYYGQMKAALGARVASRFIQVESMLDNVLDLQVGSEIPLVR